MWAGNLDPRGIGGEEPQEANTATQTATNFLSIVTQPTPPSLSPLDLVLCIAISDGHHWKASRFFAFPLAQPWSSTEEETE